jgi:DNA-directed RNA polymerase I, II, and III subunit RPABC2
MDRLTKYEIARVIGTRATQISDGAPPMVDIGDLDNALDIARKEFEANRIPLTIQRTYPNGQIKEISLCK